MTGYKGRQSAKAVEGDFPHFVDMVVPLGGLGNRLDAMYEFHTWRGIKPQRGYGWSSAHPTPLKFYSATPARPTSQATTIIDGMTAESTPSKKFKFILAD
jgi:hypothetical protein